MPDPQIRRRTLAKGVVWAAPVVAVATAAPAVAASTTLQGKICKISYGTGGWSTQQTTVYFSFEGPEDTLIPKGTTYTWTVSMDPTTGYKPSGSTTTPSAATPNVTSGTGYTLTSSMAPKKNSKEAQTFTITFTATENIQASSVNCKAGIVWSASVNNGAYTPGTTIAVAGDAGSKRVQWKTPRRWAATSEKPQYGPAFAHIFSSALSCYPAIEYSDYTAVEGQGSQSEICAESGASNTSTLYPGDICKSVVVPTGGIGTVTNC